MYESDRVSNFANFVDPSQETTSSDSSSKFVFVMMRSKVFMHLDESVKGERTLSG